jgi:hypothetical protein
VGACTSERASRVTTETPAKQTTADADADEDDTAGKNTRGKKSSSSKASSSVAKLTPLETQVKKCKADHPGVLLLIEVGYKFHFYGEDAEIASKVLNIFAYHPRDRLYLTASVPVPRLHIYVRRLVEAGTQGWGHSPDGDRRAQSRGRDGGWQVRRIRAQAGWTVHSKHA